MNNMYNYNVYVKILFDFTILKSIFVQSKILNIFAHEFNVSI